MNARVTNLQAPDGGTLFTGTTARTGSWNAITALADAVFTTLTVPNWGGDSTASLPLPAGATIFGNFTAITLASGKVIAYNT